MNDDLLAAVRKYIHENEQQSIERLYTHLKRNRNIPITKKKISEIRNEVRSKVRTITTSDQNNYNKKIVFPFIGGWFFDIISNRGLKMKLDQDEFDRAWAVFCHGNSGYIVAYPIPDKSAETLTKVYKHFKQECEKDGLKIYVYKLAYMRRRDKPRQVEILYPVKMIVSDLEKGWGKDFDTGEQYDTGILKMNAKENHRFLSKINAFASMLRDTYYSQGKTGNEQRTISDDEFNDFVYDWNLGYINFHGCTRGEMLADRTLELAYIAAALYYNEDVRKARAEGPVQEGEVVRVREPENRPFAPTRQNQLLTGRYQVVSTDGDQVQLVNTANPQDTRRTHYNDVHSVYENGREIFEQDRQVQQRIPSVQTPNVRRIELPPDNRRRAEQAYQEQQDKWMQLGFAPNLLSKEKYEIIEKLKEKLDNDSFNYVVGEDKDKKSFNKKVREGIKRRLNIAAGVILNKQQIQRTDGFDQSGQLLTRRGNLVQINR